MSVSVSAYSEKNKWINQMIHKKWKNKHNHQDATVFKSNGYDVNAYHASKKIIRKQNKNYYLNHTKQMMKHYEELLKNDEYYPFLKYKSVHKMFQKTRSKRNKANKSNVVRCDDKTTFHYECLLQGIWTQIKTIKFKSKEMKYHKMNIKVSKEPFWCNIKPYNQRQYIYYYKYKEHLYQYKNWMLDSSYSKKFKLNLKMQIEYQLRQNYDEIDKRLPEPIIINTVNDENKEDQIINIDKADICVILMMKDTVYNHHEEPFKTIDLKDKLSYNRYGYLRSSHLAKKRYTLYRYILDKCIVIIDGFKYDITMTGNQIVSVFADNDKHENDKDTESLLENRDLYLIAESAVQTVTDSSFKYAHHFIWNTDEYPVIPTRFDLCDVLVEHINVLDVYNIIIQYIGYHSFYFLSIHCEIPDSMRKCLYDLDSDREISLSKIELSHDCYFRNHLGNIAYVSQKFPETYDIMMQYDYEMYAEQEQNMERNLHAGDAFYFNPDMGQKINQLFGNDSSSDESD